MSLKLERPQENPLLKKLNELTKEGTAPYRAIDIDVGLEEKMIINITIQGDIFIINLFNNQDQDLESKAYCLISNDEKIIEEKLSLDFIKNVFSWDEIFSKLNPENNTSSIREKFQDLVPIIKTKKINS